MQQKTALTEYERIGISKMKIQFINGDLAGKIKDFQENEISIGREDGNTIQLMTGGVSRYHAQIIRQDDGTWVICDLDSTNGVKISGKNITGDVPLVPGMEITIGEQKLLILETAPAGQVRFFKPAENDSPNKNPRTNNELPQISGEKLLADLKSAGNTLFSRNEKSSSNGSGDSKDKTPDAPAAKNSKLLFNVIFYAALIVCVACVAKMFLDTKENTPAPSTQQEVNETANAIVYFERIAYDPETKSAFRFEMKIENGKMVCFLDDIAGQRHFKRELDLAQNYENELVVLLHNLEKSGIFQFKQKNVSSYNPERDQVHLTISFLNKFCDYKCSSSESGVEFDKCRDAIQNFLTGFGLMTIAQKREELESEAMQHLRNAIDKQENYVGDLRLLRESVLEYEAAISCFEQFTPAPPELKKARSGREKVNALLQQKLQESRNNFNRALRLADINAMILACQDIMKLAGDKSPIYRNAAEALRKVKRINSKRRR